MYKYPKTARVFHHGTVIFLPLVWLFINFEEAVGAVGISGIRWHKAFGVLFFVWVLARVLHAGLMPKPPSSVAWQHKIAKLTHFGLYGAMLAMPMLGIMMSLYGDYPVDVFGLFSIPVVVTPNDIVASYLQVLHTKVVPVVLLLMIGLHILAALYHGFILKDDTLKRMR